jgi:hypothetical protein
MEPVARWLERLGLGQYTAAFAEADIDPEVVRPSDGDLKKLRMRLGPRRRPCHRTAGWLED